MFMTPAQIASQIWRIGPLLTHSLMVTAKLSLSLCLLCLKFFTFDLFVPKTAIPLDKRIEVCKSTAAKCRSVSVFLNVENIPESAVSAVVALLSLWCVTSARYCTDSSYPSSPCGWLEERVRSGRWWGSLHTVSPCSPSPTLYCLLMEAVVIVMQ